jgi:hypothetical protein
MVWYTGVYDQIRELLKGLIDGEGKQRSTSSTRASEIEQQRDEKTLLEDMIEGIRGRLLASGADGPVIAGGAVATPRYMFINLQFECQRSAQQLTN